MKTNFIIRQTQKTDYTAVYNLIKTAFETAEHRDGTEQDYAVGLRDGAHYIPQLDLVAEQHGQLIGHIMFTKTHVDQPNGSKYNTLLVAPLSVLLEYRNQGVGTALMSEGLRIAQTQGYESAFLVGSSNYYQRFGYKHAYLNDINHETLPPEYVLCKEFIAQALKGISGVIKI